MKTILIGIRAAIEALSFPSARLAEWICSGLPKKNRENYQARIEWLIYAATTAVVFFATIDDELGAGPAVVFAAFGFLARFLHLISNQIGPFE